MTRSRDQRGVRPKVGERCPIGRVVVATAALIAFVSACGVDNRSSEVAARACEAIEETLTEYEAEGNATRGVLVSAAILDDAAEDLNDPSLLGDVGDAMRRDCPDAVRVLEDVPSDTAEAMFADPAARLAERLAERRVANG